MADFCLKNINKNILQVEILLQVKKRGIPVVSDACYPTDCAHFDQPPLAFLVHEDSPAKDTGVGRHALLLWVKSSLTQVSNLVSSTAGRLSLSGATGKPELRKSPAKKKGCVFQASDTWFSSLPFDRMSGLSPGSKQSVSAQATIWLGRRRS